MDKQRLLVFTSTFPRWKDDTKPHFVYELSKGLTKKFDVHILTPSYVNAQSHEIMDGMNVHRFRYFFKKYELMVGSGGILPTLKKNKLAYLLVPFFMIGAYFALKKALKEIKPIVVHAHWVIPQGIIASLVRKVPYVVTSHGSDILTLKKLKYVKKRVLRNAKKITVVSEALKKYILENIDDGLGIDVIPMGVDTTLFNPNKKDVSIKTENKIDGHFLISVGRLAQEKGLTYLIEAMPGVIKRFPKTKLMIIGEGPLKDEFNKRINQLKISENIIFKGWVKNRELPRYYATADIFIGPSLREGFGLTFVEAASSGCAIIGTKVGGIPEIIRQGKNGFLIGQRDSSVIYEKLIYLIENKKILSKFKKESRKQVQNIFDWKVIINKFESILGEGQNEAI